LGGLERGNLHALTKLGKMSGGGPLVKACRKRGWGGVNWVLVLVERAHKYHLDQKKKKKDRRERERNEISLFFIKDPSGGNSRGKKGEPQIREE